MNPASPEIDKIIRSTCQDCYNEGFNSCKMKILELLLDNIEITEGSLEKYINIKITEEIKKL